MFQKSSSNIHTEVKERERERHSDLQDSVNIAVLDLIVLDFNYILLRLILGAKTRRAL